MTPLQFGKIDRRTIRAIDVAAVEQNVAARNQLSEARRGVRVIRIERDTGLVKIEKRKPRAVTLRRQRRRATQRIARWRLDFPYSRAEIGEQARAVTGCGGASDLDNPQMRQRAHHASSWSDDRHKVTAGSVSCWRP